MGSGNFICPLGEAALEDLQYQKRIGTYIVMFSPPKTACNPLRTPSLTFVLELCNYRIINLQVCLEIGYSIGS